MLTVLLCVPPLKGYSNKPFGIGFSGSLRQHQSQCKTNNNRIEDQGFVALYNFAIVKAQLNTGNTSFAENTCRPRCILRCLPCVFM